MKWTIMVMESCGTGALELCIVQLRPFSNDFIISGVDFLSPGATVQDSGSGHSR